MSRQRVSVVCVTRNRAEFLRECLNSCINQSVAPIEIIVVDNASSDETRGLLDREFPEVVVIRMHRNIGFFPALNIAIANTIGELILTIDDDARFCQNDGIKRMMELMEREPETDIVTCNIEGPFEESPLLHDSYVHAFKTGFSMIRSSVFKESVGYYPDIFFRSAGETYIASKVWDQGRRVKQLVEVTMYHHRTSKGRVDRDWMFHGTRSQILVVFMRSPLLLVPVRLSSKLLNGFFHVLKRPRLFLWWLHGWGSAITKIPEALRYRAPVSMATERLLNELKRSPTHFMPATIERRSVDRSR